MSFRMEVDDQSRLESMAFPMLKQNKGESITCIVASRASDSVAFENKQDSSSLNSIPTARKATNGS